MRAPSRSRPARRSISDGFDQTIGSLAGAGTSTLGAATLTTGGDGTSTTFSGAITGTGGLDEDRRRRVHPDGRHTYTGPTTVNGGILDVNGSIASRR